MILGLEDIAVIFTLLTPVYYATFRNTIDVSQMKQQIHEIQKKVKIC